MKECPIKVINDLVEEYNKEDYYSIEEDLEETMKNLKELKNNLDILEKEYEKTKEKQERAIRRISIVRMDEDTSIETHKALDFVLQALIGADKE